MLCDSFSQSSVLCTCCSCSCSWCRLWWNMGGGEGAEKLRHMASLPSWTFKHWFQDSICTLVHQWWNCFWQHPPYDTLHSILDIHQPFHSNAIFESQTLLYCIRSPVYLHRSEFTSQMLIKTFCYQTWERLLWLKDWYVYYCQLSRYKCLLKL